MFNARMDNVSCWTVGETYSTVIILKLFQLAAWLLGNWLCSGWPNKDILCLCMHHIELEGCWKSFLSVPTSFSCASVNQDQFASQWIGATARQRHLCKEGEQPDNPTLFISFPLSHLSHTRAWLPLPPSYFIRGWWVSLFWCLEVTWSRTLTCISGRIDGLPYLVIVVEGASPVSSPSSLSRHRW